MYSNDTGYNDLFYAIESALDYSYYKSYDKNYTVSDMLAKCKIKLYNKTDNYSYNDEYNDEYNDKYNKYNEFIIYYDMESYDNEYKYKIEKLFKKKYFKNKLYLKLEKYFKEYDISNYNKIYISDINVIDNAISLNERLKGFGIMIAFICGIFTISGSVIFFYNRTETHQKHLKQIADEFGFEDISEVSQITHFKLF